MMLIPIMTLFMYLAVLLNIPILNSIIVFPILRSIIVFIYLSFIPGFAILSLFRLKGISFLNTILFSVGLSVSFVMLISLLVNELYVFLGISQALSTFPLMVAISAFPLAIFFVEYRRDLQATPRLDTSPRTKTKDVLPLSVILVLLPILSILGSFYRNIPIMLLSYAIIAALCIMSIASKRHVPQNLFPLVILSISIALICQVLLMSKYLVGFDAYLEYYVFRVTQINGHWGLLNAVTNPLITLTYNAMLSITLLPATYATLMNTQGEIVFKILYPFIFCLVPLILYQIFEKTTGKLIGLLSTLFFVFTPSTFFAVEPLSLNRQIVGELFLLLSIFVLLNNTISVKKRRLLLIIFGASLAVSHYALAFLYLAIVILFFAFSKIKPKFDETKTLNSVTVLLIFALPLLWYTFGSSAPLTALANTVESVFDRLTAARVQAGTTASIYYLPQTMTAATWINMALSIIINLFLIIGVLAIIARPKRTGLSARYIALSIIAGTILATALLAPGVAAILNFTRFYAISVLFLSPCVVLGGVTILETIRSAFAWIKRSLRSQRDSKNMHVNGVLLLIAIVFGAYFLSQSGFINYVSGGDMHSLTLDFDRMRTSSDRSIEISFYSLYIQEHDAFSAQWLSNNMRQSSMVYADVVARRNVLTCYGLVPQEQVLLLSNETTALNLEPGAFVYLGQLNVAIGVVITNTGPINTSEILVSLNESDLVYSNGNSDIWRVCSPR